MAQLRPLNSSNKAIYQIGSFFSSTIYIFNLMIYKLLRKEISSRTPQLSSMTDNQNSQSHFIEEISRLLKLVKKKEELYLRLLQQNNRLEGLKLEEASAFAKQYQNYLEEGRKIQRALDSFKKQSFYSSKTYIYTTFMRYRQHLELHSRRFKAQGKRQLEKRFDEAKNAFVQIYNESFQEERQMLDEIISFINKNQNNRISQFLPRINLNSIISLNRSKLAEKLKCASNESNVLRKTLSVQLVKNNDFKLQSIINKKLIVQEMATQKRIQQRKKSKIKTTNLFKLYDVLNLRPFPADRSYSLKQQLETNMIQRNYLVRQQMKAFEKKWLLFKYVKKEKK